MAGSENKIPFGRGRGRGIPAHIDVPLRRPSLDIVDGTSQLKLKNDSPFESLEPEEITTKVNGIKSAKELKDLVDALVEKALDSRDFGEKMLNELKKVISFTVEEKKLRNVFLSRIQAAFQDKDSILRISQERYANLINLLGGCTRNLRMPNGDPIKPLITAVAESLSPVLRGSITYDTSVCVRRTVFSLIDDLRKHSSSQCDDFFEKVRELVVRNSLEMNIGNELLFLVELEHYHSVGEIPSAVFTYYRAKGIKFD